MRNDVKAALRGAGLGVVVLLCIAVAFVLFTFWRWGHYITFTIRSVVESLAAKSGISTTLLYGIVIIATIPFFWAVAKYMSGMWFWLRGLGPGLRLYKSVHGMIIVAYVGLYFLAVFFVSRNSLAYKFCAVTPEGTRIFDDRVKDPVYGIQAEPCTFDQIVDIRRANNPGIGPQRVLVADASTFQFFETVTGRPLIWYYKSPNGEYRFFDRQGNDPETGAPLRSVDRETRDEIIRMQDQQAAAGRQRERESVASRFLNTSVAKHAGSKLAAILSFSNESDKFADLESDLNQAASNRGLSPVRAFFKPQFVQEGGAGRLFGEDFSEATQLGMADRIDLVLIGNARISVTESSDFNGVITTTLVIGLKCLNLARQTVCGDRNVQTTGAGYSRDESLKNAVDKARPDVDAFVNALTLN